MAITFRTAHSANASSVAITTPASKDIIVVFAYNNASTTIPTLAAGYTSIQTNSTTLSAASVAYKISDGTETTSGTWTNATNVVVLIFRGAFVASIGASSVGNSTALTYTTFTLKNTSGTSWVAGFGGAKAATAGMNGTMAVLDNNRSSQTTVNGLDTGNGVSSYAGETLNVTTSGRWITFTIELIAFPDIAETLTQSEGAKTQIRGGAFDYNLIDSVGLDTVVTGTSNDRDQLSLVDKLVFVDANKAAFIAEADILAQSDTVAPTLGILLTAADQMTLADAFAFSMQIPEVLSDQIVLSDSIAMRMAMLKGITDNNTPGMFEGYASNGATLALKLQDNPLGLSIAQSNYATGSGVFGIDIELPRAVAPSSLVVLMAYFKVTFNSLNTAQQVIGDFSSSLTKLASSGTGIGGLNYGAQYAVFQSNGGTARVALRWSQTASDVQVALFEMPGAAFLATDSFTTDGAATGANQSTFSSAYNFPQWSNNYQGVIALGGCVSFAGTSSLLTVAGAGVPIFSGVVGANGSSMLPLFNYWPTVNNGGHVQASTQPTFKLTLSPSTDIAIPGFYLGVLNQGALDDLQYVETPSAIFVDDDISNQADSLTLGYGNRISDQLTAQADAMLFKLLGGSFVYQLLDASGTNSVDGDTTGQDQLVQIDPTFTETMDLNLSLVCPEFSGLWNDSSSQTLTTGGALTETLADAMALSDALAIGYGQGQVDALSFSDSSSLGYGDLISDALSLSDSEAAALGMLKTFSDQLVLSDSEIIGYGNATVDQLTFSDTNSIGYGDLISETLVLSDSLIVGYGQANVDSLTFSDSTSIGYGDQISDTLSLSDTERNVLGINELFSDQLVFTDSIAAGYGNAVSDQLVLSDSSSLLFGVNSTFSETLTISDSNSLGYGFLIADSFSLTDSLTSLFSIAETLSDTLTMSDSEIIGYGNATVDSLTFLDSSSVGYGDVISDTMPLSDSEVNVLGLNELFSDQLVLTDSFAEVLSIAEMFSDTLVFSDSIAAGYGNAVSDQLVLSDSEVIGYGQGTVDSLTFSDTNAIGYGDLISDSFTLTDSFAFNSGASLITESLSDTLTLSDFLAVGYGQGSVDSLTLTDNSSLGYGDIISDTITLSDSDTNVLGQLKSFSDQLVLTDSFADQLSIAESFSDTLTQTDSETIGYGNQFTEQLIFVEGPLVGFGDLISDSLNNWLDAFQFTSGQPSISLQFSEQLALSEALGAGYGNSTSDQNTLSDVMSLVESFEVLLSEATPQMVEVLTMLMTQAMAAQDSVAFLNDTYSAIGSYLVGLSDIETLTDQFGAALVGPLVLLLSDAEGAAWLDSLLVEFVFSPGAVRMQALRILNELVAEIKTTRVLVTRE